jgi:hypothetical protein
LRRFRAIALTGAPLSIVSNASLPLIKARTIK